ncbi:MAG: NAD-dependent epimerase/dehydratase family protein [Deltaproteobacteria bacterium]|nr:NAD-dependent epimerase/dehydratase family protein [Deltaproteobacteria bacterium]
MDALAGRTALVTGASGFLGGHLVEALVGHGARVRALVRRSSDTTALRAHGVELFQGGFEDLEGLRLAVAGADYVVHAAGGGKVASVEDFYAQNRDTTQLLLQVILQEAPHLERFVLVSSAAAAGPSEPARPATEDGPPHPTSHYGKAKLAAEQLVLLEKARLPVTVIRPPAVYGPGDTRMLGLFKAIRRGVMPRLGRGGVTSMIYVSDCVDAILLALVRPHPTGRIYFVADGEPYDHARVGRAIAAAVGASPVTVPLPGPLLRAAGAVTEAFGKATGRPVALTRDKVQDLLQPSWLVSAALARSELGFAPKVLLEEGAKRTAEGYRRAGWMR